MIIPEAVKAIHALTVATKAVRHHGERGLVALILMIATTNVHNRLNITPRQVAGAWG